MKMVRTAAVLAAGLLVGSSFAIDLSLINTFEGGDDGGWMEGLPSPNPPGIIPLGGPDGGTDAFLRNISSGSFGAGGRMVMFNLSDWTGDYLAAGVNGISMFARAVPTGAPLNLRLALGDGDSWYATDAFALPNDNVWRPYSFSLAPGDLINVDGTNDAETVLANVIELRILSSADPDFIGDVVDATLDVDDVAAVPEPAAAVLLAGAALVLIRRQR